jgi:hypothetical protein
MIRPDDLEGITNPIHWALSRAPYLSFCLNLLLAPPFVFSKSYPISAYYGKKDFFVIANQSVMPAFGGLRGRDCFFEPRTDVVDFTPNAKNSLSSKIAVYIGKGIARKVEGLDSFAESKGLSLKKASISYISRTWPDSKKDLYEILSKSALLISFDPFSHIEREATMLGVPVLKPNSLNTKELPGVFTSVIELIKLDLPFLRTAIRSHAWDDYLTGRSSNNFAISRLCTALEELLANADYRSMKVSIPFSRDLLYAFGSQLRAYLPLVGQMHLASVVNRMQTEDIEQILSGNFESSIALEYKRKVASFPFRTKTGDTLAERRRHAAPIIYSYRGSHA